MAVAYSNAAAQVAPANGQKFRGSVVGMPIAGSDVRGGADSLAYMVRVDADGSLHVKSDDLPESRNTRTTVVSAVVGKNSGVFVGNFPIPIKGAKYITLQVLMTPGTVAADTDSVNVEIYPMVKQTDLPTDGINEVFDLDQTDAYVTPLYFTRNQTPMNAGIAGAATWSRRVFCGRQAGQAAAGAFNTCAMAALVDDSGAPLQGEYLTLKVINRNIGRDITIEISAYLHYE